MDVGKPVEQKGSGRKNCKVGGYANGLELH